MQSAKKEAIILSRRDYGETDRLLCIYSLETGKQTVLAKGVRKPLSKLGGFLEQFSHVELVLSGGKLAIVNDSNILHSLKDLRSDYSLVEKANHIAQTLQILTEEESEHPELFHLLLESLLLLSKKLVPELIPAYFYLNFLKLHGFAPNLEACGDCDCDLCVDQVYFGEPYNCFHCAKCGSAKEPQLSVSNAKLLKLILGQKLSFLSKISGLQKTDLEKLEALSLAMLSYHFEKELKFQ
ncbi:MAG: DNA repair protein RecO [Candidatus Gracilibacteria bacterium]|nr:DNA repair protein RecO [Candidatus Gracilibacteria bacterium]